MHIRKDLVADTWQEYELLDSGDNKKLERYGAYIVSRPDTQSIWNPLTPEAWHSAHAEFSSDTDRSSNKAAWRARKDIPESWNISWHDAGFTVRLTSFKHTGIFPEQAANWTWIQQCLKNKPDAKMLNLFGYTGIASVVAAQAMAQARLPIGQVTHVDASKQSLNWAHENAELSGVTSGIRYILDDALKFAKREVRRGAQYDGIILDPPAFGRGPKGETWKIEEDLPELLDTVRQLLSDKPGSFFLLNGYAAGYTPQSFLQLVESHFGNKIQCEFGELSIPEKNSNRVISAGIYVRFVR